jgi:acylphosphatase
LPLARLQAAVKCFDFTVTGRVQGVFFRNFTKEKADALGVVGWVRNTADGKHVVGQAEGPAAAMEAFQKWLTTEGSPRSRIESAAFTEVRELAAPTGRWAEFSVDRDTR